MPRINEIQNIKEGSPNHGEPFLFNIFYNEKDYN